MRPSPDERGLRLCSRYSYLPNSLGYCGPPDVNERILEYALGGGCSDIREILTKFEALHPYLELIAGSNGFDDEFDIDVVEALWVGNRLLEAVSSSDIQDMIHARFKGYLPGRILECMVDRIPEGSLPHHSFHVLHIQTITGVISRSVENQDMCRISWGTVKEKEDKLLVDSQKLTVEDGRYKLVPCEKEIEHKAAGRTFTEPEPGDATSIHWNMAVEALDGARLSNLLKYTEHNLNLLKPLLLS
ncbi:MAG: hypothetical protein GF416_01435 [Candidatus Altiarchaeales archaeon]|nr:hypothetical protein [Candidatus Altiarchaeales archaeon]MBD3415777.1 hypothetical protein [Candidatus Altiarchaeales archaeon]